MAGARAPGCDQYKGTWGVRAQCARGARSASVLGVQGM